MKCLQKYWLFVICAACCLSACNQAGTSDSTAARITGYVEADYIYISSPSGGKLTTLPVVKGQDVKAGDVAFELDQMPEKQLVAEARLKVEQSSSRLRDLQKGLRPTEIASIEAQVSLERSELRLAELELQRRNTLSRSNAISSEELQRAIIKRDVSQQKLAALEAELATAFLGAREDAVQVAEHEVEISRAVLERLTWGLAEKRQVMAVGGVVFDTYYEVGEYVPASRPVVALLPLDNLKVRIFVPEAKLGVLHQGQVIEAVCDNCQSAVKARVSYISSQAEFTPPVIFSRQQRTKLVYLVEAKIEPESARVVKVGQPVDVLL